MDTWEWYNNYSKELRDAGQGYIPQIIDDFSEGALNLQLEKCDALLPEMKALNQVAKKSVAGDIYRALGDASPPDEL